MYFDGMDIRIENILKSKSIKNAQQLAKSGIPSGSRAQIWDLILQTDFVDNLKDYVNHFLSKDLEYYLL